MKTMNTTSIGNHLRVALKHSALALAVAVGLVAGSAQAVTTTATYNLGTQVSPQTIESGIGGLLPWIAKGVLPAGSILKSVSIDAIIENVGNDGTTDDWAQDICAYIDPSPEAAGTAALLQVGGYGTIGTVTKKIGWPNGDDGPRRPVIGTMTAAAWSILGDIDLSTVQLSVGNDWSQAAWSGTITVEYDIPEPARIFSFGIPGSTVVIDQGLKTISLTVPYDADWTNLMPTYTLSSGTCDKDNGGSTGYDFSNSATVPVVYTVTDSGASAQNSYDVTVTLAPPPAPISFGPTTGTGTLAFGTLPSSSEWSCLSVPGTGGTATDLTGLDALVNTLASTDIATVLPTVTADPGAGAAGGAWNSTSQRLTSRATGTAAAAMMATLRNDSGAALYEFDLNFTLSGADPTGEDPGLAGYAVYYSLTGATDSWQRIGVYGTPGAVTVTNIPLSSAWANTATLYVLWVDDNGSPAGDSWYGIDDVKFAPSVPLTAPVGLTATPGDGKMELAWTAFLGATGYNVKLWNGASYDTISTNQPGTTYTHSGLTNGTTYQYVVSAMTGVVESDNSAEVTATPATPPPVPGGVTDLALWLDASQLTGLSDDATVDTWTDMSGVGNDAPKTAGTPIYKTGVLNGQPVIRFNNTSAFTTANLSAQFPSAVTVFIVTTINNDNNYTLVKANPNSADEWWRYDNGKSYPAVFRSSRLETYCDMPNSGSHLFTISSSASAWEMWKDGASQGVAGAAYNAGGALVIGNGSSGGGLNGDIAEILIYSRALTAPELNTVGGYLTAKYGLNTAYPLDLTVTLTSPTNTQAYPTGTSITATATVTEPGLFTETVTFHTTPIAPSGATVETVSTDTSSPFSAELGPLPDGTYEIYATVVNNDTPPGTATSATRTFTVAAAIPTTTTLATSGTPTTYGQNVTFTATVSPIPTGGTVQFYDGIDPLGSPATVNTTTGEATYSTTTLGAGTHVITAQYNGYQIYETSTTASSISQEVGQAPLTVTALNTYRTVNTANPVQFPYEITGYQNGENLATSGVTGTPFLSTEATLSSPVGPYVITCDPGDLAASNYSFTLVNGTLTITDLAGQLGVLNLGANGGINPATGVAWALGDTYRLVFVTSGTTACTSTDIATYNSFVQGLADAAGLGTSALGPVTWKAVGSTATVDARDNTGTNPTISTGEPILRMDGTFVIANNYADLWNGINASHVVGQNYLSVYLDENGVERIDERVRTGSAVNGTASTAMLGGSADATPRVQTGRNYNPNFYGGYGGNEWMQDWGENAADAGRLYAMSGILTIVSTNPTGFTGWAAAQVPPVTGGINGDSNNDGVQNGIAYFMNSTGLITNPGITGNTVTWPNGGNIPAADYGTQFVVQTSPDLVTWTPVPSGNGNLSNTGGSVSYTLPSGAGKLFVRLLVTPTP